jgi:hypothetical protein
MGWQAIAAAPRNGDPVFPAKQDPGDMTAAYWAVRQGVAFRFHGASTAYFQTHWRRESRAVAGSLETSTVGSHPCVAAGVCVLWLFIGVLGDKAQCGESNTRARALVAPTEEGRAIARLNATHDDSLQLSKAAEPAQAPQSAPTSKQQGLEHEQPWDRAETLARALTSSLRTELDVVRSTAEAALEQERGRADALAGQLASVQAVLETARVVGLEAVQASEAEIKERQSLEQERGRADALGREVISLRAELDAARTASPKVTQAAAAAVEQTQTLEMDLKHERDKADALDRELTSLREKLDAARAEAGEAVPTAEEIEQELAFKKEHDQAERLARELASARKEAEERSVRLAAVYAEVLQVTQAGNAKAAEQELIIASERDRADALARELASEGNRPEAGNWQIAALNAFRALRLREPPVDSSQVRDGRVLFEDDRGKGALNRPGLRRSRRVDLGTAVRFGIAASGGAVGRPRRHAELGSESRHGGGSNYVGDCRFAPPDGQTEATCPGNRIAPASRY